MNPRTDTNRRQFLKSSAVAAGALTLGGCASRTYPQGSLTAWSAKRQLGRTDLQVGMLGFGGAEIGFGAVEQPRVDLLLNIALDEGLDTIDTAACYRESEVQIATAVAHRRDEYNLFSKVGHFPDRDGWSKQDVMLTVERSLTRLKTDRIDVVHLHSCGLDVLERGEALAALEQARDDGKLRYIGYSGDSQEALYAVRTGRFDTLMTSISFADQQAIELTLPECRARHMGVIVKRGLANAVWRYQEEPDNSYHQEYWKRMVELDYDFTNDPLREDDGPEGPAGTALRFVLGLPGVHTTVVGTTNPTRYAQNLDLLAAGPLPEARVNYIRQRWEEVAPPTWVGQI